MTRATDVDPFAPLVVIEAAIAARLARPWPDRPVALREAMEYATLGAGKRLRPILAWHCCAACGGSGEQSLPAGVAVELVHAFSLVHDDLPALDNDDLRRGKPTLHKHAGEAMAILAGDQLLVEAFACVLERAPAHLGRDLALMLAQATSGMVGGQVFDTLGGLPAQLDPAERVALVHRNKTGALIRAACAMGAVCALGRPDQAVDAYGQAMGLMFQVVDDIIDVTQSAEHTGKRTGKDAQAGKLTYPGVLGLDGARAQVQDLLGHALTACERMPPGTGPTALATLARQMATRTK